MPGAVKRASSRVARSRRNTAAWRRSQAKSARRPWKARPRVKPPVLATRSIALPSGGDAQDVAGLAAAPDPAVRPDRDAFGMGEPGLREDAVEMRPRVLQRQDRRLCGGHVAEEPGVEGQGAAVAAFLGQCQTVSGDGDVGDCRPAGRARDNADDVIDAVLASGCEIEAGSHTSRRERVVAERRAVAGRAGGAPILDAEHAAVSAAPGCEVAPAIRHPEHGYRQLRGVLENEDDVVLCAADHRGPAERAFVGLDQRDEVLVAFARRVVVKVAGAAGRGQDMGEIRGFHGAGEVVAAGNEGQVRRHGEPFRRDIDPSAGGHVQHRVMRQRQSALAARDQMALVEERRVRCDAQRLRDPRTHHRAFETEVERSGAAIHERPGRIGRPAVDRGSVEIVGGEGRAKKITREVPLDRRQWQVIGRGIVDPGRGVQRRDHPLTEAEVELADVADGRIDRETASGALGDHEARVGLRRCHVVLSRCRGRCEGSRPRRSRFSRNSRSASTPPMTGGVGGAPGSVRRQSGDGRATGR